jgi:hypothetical protein
MFVVTGPLNITSQPIVVVAWDYGVLAGHALAIAEALDRAAALDGESVGTYEGPYTSTASGHLTEPTSALFVITSVFVPDQYVIAGDVPERPPIPPGAIG